MQYSEFPERAEFVNIGIIVFSPDNPRVMLRFSRTSRRAERLFNTHFGKHFLTLQESLSERVCAEFGSGWTKDAIDKFVALRSGKIRLASARSVFVKDGPAVLHDLFDRLVGETPRITRGPKSKTRLTQAFRRLEVERFLSRPAPVELPGGVMIDAPYAFKNGALNLIDIVSLAGEPEQALNRASPHMIEGAMLRQGTALADPKRLVIVGDHAETQEPSLIQLIADQMESHEVKFFTMDDIGVLAGQIRENFNAHQQAS